MWSEIHNFLRRQWCPCHYHLLHNTQIIRQKFPSKLLLYAFYFILHKNFSWSWKDPLFMVITCSSVIPLRNINYICNKLVCQCAQLHSIEFLTPIIILSWSFLIWNPCFCHLSLSKYLTRELGLHKKQPLVVTWN